jgi:hypothetical protein
MNFQPTFKKTNKNAKHTKYQEKQSQNAVSCLKLAPKAAKLKTNYLYMKPNDALYQ